jgi:hypothetical protein
MVSDSTQGDTLFWYCIPHVASLGDSLSYYIAATDSVLNRNTSGLYTFHVGETGIEEQITGIQESALFNLYQSNPNPFTNSTSIHYQLMKPAKVTLEIYDILGGLVTTLVSEEQLAGTYNAAWTGKDARGRQVASGIYFCRMEVGEQAKTRQLILLK